MSDQKIVIWPPRMFGKATIGESRLPAYTVAGTYWECGLEETIRCWDYLDRDDVLLCCWYVGTHGSRTEKKRFGQWSQEAFDHFWNRELSKCPDPPRKP